MRLKDKVIVLTGSNGLIGKDLKGMLFREGAKLAVIGHKKKGVNSILLTNESGSILADSIDVTKKKSIKKCFKRIVDHFGKIDLLINNAGIDRKIDDPEDLYSIPFEDYPSKKIKECIDVNMMGTIKVTQRACKHFLKQGYGNIINIGSIYSMLSPNPSSYAEGKFKPVDYVVSKSFIPNFTRYITACYSKENIICNALAFTGIGGYSEKLLEDSPAHNMCNVQDIFEAIVYLSNYNYMNGQTLMIDGGLSVW